MFCKTGIFVNWGNIPHLEMDFGPINLFSGGNGSGKTTAADGLQSLMTAAHENLFTYNPGQDETTQRGRGGKLVRTLASYVLGCDDGSYARPRTVDGYVAGVFHPTQGESGEVFTAVMCVRASLDSAGSSRQARQDDILFLIVPHEELKLEHFVREDKGGKYVVPLTEIAHLLKKEFGKDAIEIYDKKGPYLRRLYGALKGQKGAVSDREAKHAARTFSNFMAYKPVKSITEFVAKEILEPKDLSDDIRQVSELMKTIHSMEDETRKIKGAIENLEIAQNLAHEYVNHWTIHCVGEYSEITRCLLLKQQEYLKYKNEQRLNLDAIDETESKMTNNDNKKSLLREQLVSLEAKRQGIEALKTKDQLDSDIEDYHKALVLHARPLLEQDQQFTQNHHYAHQLSHKLKEISLAVDVQALEHKDFRKSLKQLIDLGANTGIDAQQLLGKDWVDVSALEHKLENLMQLELVHKELHHFLYDASHNIEKVSIRDQVVAVTNKRREVQEKIRQQLNVKQIEIQKLENHTVSYPPHVDAAVSAIALQCPKARPCVLCDFIEVMDPEWQMAIEGYIGGARFSIIVEPEYEAEAIRIVRHMKGRKNNARVIQGAKAQKDAGRLTLPKGSIFEVMKFEHKIVEYYIKASYGSVLRVVDEEALKQTARGITSTGIGSGNYSMFRCDLEDAELVFGQGARERALSAKQEQWRELQNQSHRAEEEYRQVAYVNEVIDKIKSIHCADVIKEMLSLYRKLQKAENQLAHLDLSDYKELEEKLKSLKDEFDSIELIGKDLGIALGRLKEKIQQFERNIAKLANEQEELQEQQENHEKAVYHIAKVYADFDCESALRQADDQANKAKNDFSFEDQNRDCLIQLDRYERNLHDVIMQHNQASESYNGIMYHTGSGERNDAECFSCIVKLTKDIENVYNGLKNNVLFGKHESLKELRDSFNTAFVTNLCHSIYQSINDGKRILDDLNKELEGHRFGADGERFYFAYEWVPEYREYQRFFKEVIDIPNLGDGSTLFDADLSDKSCAVRDKLLEMLLDKDEQVALRDLKRLSDYRNYRYYEIYKEPLNKEPIALSKYGTGSGGQLETPAYIIRSAAVTSAFRFNEGNTHCRMVLVDEAFSKMDETRSREVINYLTETLGLQLIFIMPTSKSGPFMDLISHQVIFSKCPTTEKIGELNTRVLVDRKTCNTDKIQQLWANHRKTVRQQGMLDFMEEYI